MTKEAACSGFVVTTMNSEIRAIRHTVLLLFLVNPFEVFGQATGTEASATTMSVYDVRSGFGKASQELKLHGFSAQVSLTTDTSVATDESDQTRCYLRSLVDMHVGFDTSKGLGWSGGTVVVRFHQYAERNAPDEEDDAQRFSNIDADDVSTGLYEVWFEQKTLSNRLRFKVGKIDANTEFATVQSASDFLNSSMGYSPTLLEFPTYPRSNVGALAFISPGRGYQIGSGFFKTGGGVMSLVEGGRGWELGSRELGGRASFGYWHLDGPIRDDDGEMTSKHGTHGYYMVLEQSPWRQILGSQNKERRLSLFFQFGDANGRVSEFTGHVGGGAVLSGVSKFRSADEIGLGITHVSLSREMDEVGPSSAELTWEGFYKFNIDRWIALTVDTQYVEHPSGMNSGRNFAVVTPRLSMQF